jgi:hypothetical protein
MKRKSPHTPDSFGGDERGTNSKEANSSEHCIKLFLKQFIGFEANLNTIREDCMSPKYATRAIE